ncbi:TPA: phosphotransferase [Legionella pneumophila]|nr:phosphotransferase [Legionella pneumophila]HAU0298301.1 phosphotransferase [Legionella pneumophila]
MNYSEQSHQEMIKTIIIRHFNEMPKSINRITIGICNEVYSVPLNTKEVIVRLSSTDKYLRGSQVHIPEFKGLGIKVPDILAEDYSQSLIPFCYQIQNKFEGQDLGLVIESLNEAQLKKLAHEIAVIFRKVETLPVTAQYGVVWGGDNDLSDSWSERMKLWVEESIERGKITGVMDSEMESIATQLYLEYTIYFNSVKPTMYYGDICSKNVMIHEGLFNGLVDLDGLTQGDPLEALGRIKLSWFDTPYGDFYSNAIMEELALDKKQCQLVMVYALLNQISWACENGIQFNQNTKPVVNWEKAKKDKAAIKKLFKLLRKYESQ